MVLRLMFVFMDNLRPKGRTEITLFQLVKIALDELYKESVDVCGTNTDAQIQVQCRGSRAAVGGSPTPTFRWGLGQVRVRAYPGRSASDLPAKIKFFTLATD